MFLPTLLTSRSPHLGVIADPAVYTREQCAAVLSKVHDGSGGGLQLVCKVLTGPLAKLLMVLAR